MISMPHMTRIIAPALLCLVVSCTKKDLSPTGTASLTVVNAMVGSGSLIPDFNKPGGRQSYYIDGPYANYGLFTNASMGGTNQISLSGTQQMTVYDYPDTLPTSRPVLTLTLNLPIGSISSLFFTGTLTSPDTLLTVDHPPYYPVSDSVVGIRFVNLSPGSAPISINIQGQANGSEAGSLSYKGITGFKSYPATSNISSYTFEFRDAASGTLLTNFVAAGIDSIGTDLYTSANPWRYRNFTLALLGLPGGMNDSAQTVLLIGNY